MCANCIIDSDFFYPLDKLTVKLVHFGHQPRMSRKREKEEGKETTVENKYDRIR